MTRLSPDLRRTLAAYRVCGGAKAIQVPTKPLSEAAFRHWLSQAEPGVAIQYHVGLLLQDRLTAGRRVATAESRRVDRLAQQAWDAREQGLLHLFSQALGSSRYRYLGIRSCRPWPTPVKPLETPPWVSPVSATAIH
jgi:hypothetical protein